MTNRPKTLFATKLFRPKMFLPPKNGLAPNNKYRTKHNSVPNNLLTQRKTFGAKKVFGAKNVLAPTKKGFGAKKCFGAKKTFLATKFLSEKYFVNTPKNFSAKCLFWRSCAGLDVTGRCGSKIHCQTYRFQPSTTLGGGVKREKAVFFRSFGQKTDLIPSSLHWRGRCWQDPD